MHTMATTCPGSSCAAYCTPRICVAPPPPLNVNWGAAAFAATRGAVVAVTNRSGIIAGGGFWISSRAVATAWHVVAGQYDGVRVAVYQTGGPPLVLDAVLLHAVPAYDVAFLLVNPMTVADAVVSPTILRIALDATAGQDVFTLVATSTIEGPPLGEGLSMAAGVVRQASNYFADYSCALLTDMPVMGNAAGAPIIRAPDYTIVGMAQQGFTGSTAGGVDARLLLAACSWALQDVPALSSAFVLGPVTSPVIRPGLALGQLFEIELEGGSVSAYVPMPSAGSNTRLTEMGLPATGATVGNVALADSTPFKAVPPVSSPDILYSGNQTVEAVPGVPGAAIALQTEYIVASQLPGVFTDISTDGGVVNITALMDPTQGYADISGIVLPGRLLRISGAPSPVVGTLAACTTASDVYVSAGGLVAFRATGSVATVVPDVETVIATIEQPFTVRFPGESLIYAAPFASKDFMIGISGLFDDVVNAGTRGACLQVWGLASGDTFTIQWDGFAVSTGAPVSFQVILRTDNAIDDPLTVWASGQVLFAYRPDVMTGPWAGSQWLTGTSMTLGGVDAPPYTIAVPLPPLGGQAIYWGLHMQASTSDLLATACTPAALNASILSPRGQFAAQPLAPYAYGTVVVAQQAAPFFNYSLFSATTTTAATVVALNSNAIGALDLNYLSLPDVLAMTGVGASALNPLPVTALFRSVAYSAPATLSATALGLFVGGGRDMGASSGASAASSASSYSFVPYAATTAGSYSASLLPLPTSALVGLPVAEPQQANLRLVTGSITIPTLSYPTDPVMFVVSIASTNSTLLDDYMDAGVAASADGGTTAILCIDTAITAGQYDVTLSYRYGYGNTASTYTSAVVTQAAPIAVTFTLYVPEDVYVPRLNTLVLGRPPTASFAPQYDIGATRYLVSGDVSLDSVLVSTRVVTAVTDGQQYAVVSTPRDVGPRPNTNLIPAELGGLVI